MNIGNWIDAFRPAEGPPPSLRTAVAACLAFTWLNPHVYLDTLVLIGSVASQYGNRLIFGLGAITSSFVFFFSLGYGFPFPSANVSLFVYVWILFSFAVPAILPF